MKHGWEIKKLGEFIKEYSVRNKNGVDFPVYSVTNSQGFCKDYFSKEVASKEKSTYKIVPRGCFAYNPSRINVGSVDWQNHENNVIVSPLYVVFEVSDKLNNDFLLYYLKSNHTMQLIKNLATGTVRANLRFDILSSFPIPIPPLPIQERIVSELDCINGILEKKREQIKELDALAQSIFYDMFGDPIQNEKGWEVKKLGESFLFQQGMQVPVEEQYEEKEEGMERFLRIIDFTQGNEPPRYVNVKSEKHMLRDGEVAIVRYGSPGFVCFGKEGIIANNLFKIIPNLTINSTYFIYWLNSEAFQSVVKGNQYGAALQAIKFSTINGIGIILPPLPLQQAFAAKIEAIENQKELVKRSIAETETLLASRMQHYFEA